MQAKRILIGAAALTAIAVGVGIALSPEAPGPTSPGSEPATQVAAPSATRNPSYVGEDDRAEAEAPTPSTPALSSHGSGSVGIPNQSGGSGRAGAPQERPSDPVGERDAFTNAFKTLDYSTLATVSRGRLRAAFEAQVGREEIRAGDDERNKLRSLVTANFRRPSDDEYRFRLQSDLPRYQDYRLDVVMRRTSGRWYVEEMLPAAP